MFTGLHVKYPLFWSYFNGTWILLTDIKKTLKIHENPLSGS